MARHVKIGNICGIACEVDINSSYDSMVDNVLEHLDGQVQKVLPDNPDLVVLPEACDRPPNIKPDVGKMKAYYQTRGTRVLDYFRKVASENSCYVAYSAAREGKDGRWWNSTQIIDREGKIAGIYSKNHLTIGENENSGMTYGTEAPLIKCDFGSVACAICFDMNFNELRLKYASESPDLVLFSSMYHGGLMQYYWAYSCRAHFVGSIGNSPYAGHIISPVGKMIASTTNYYNVINARVNLDCCVAHLDYNRERFTALKKKYGEAVRIDDPGFLGSVLISSETADKNVMEMVREFDIELLDDYFNRALEHRRCNMQP